ncbi:hypothetical protein GCM10010532_069970 [Dactylosporangium siamense]|uniref:TetR family transcriptional regulator n=1 Tax=Dactylosporangium siamense TaxID=685454 RepID=A0A919PMY0_9ACTN|nr:hypothetical protein Dsi01nite_051180 [Dactylosporangium siamense]
MRHRGSDVGGTDLEAVAAFYTTVLHGMAIQSRDGATRAQLQAVISRARSAWDSVVDTRSAS